MNKLGRVGLIGRFKPLHHGGAKMLDKICEQTDYLVIGLGSSNMYNLRNPFTVEESKQMIDVYLSSKFSNYEFMQIPDYGHIKKNRDGQRWRQEIITNFKNLDHFLSGNPYVSELLKDDYQMIHPDSLIDSKQNSTLFKTLSATKVRVAMVKDEDWKSLIPDVVVNYLESNGLVERFKKEFGEETLALATSDPNYGERGSLVNEKERIIKNNYEGEKE